MTAVSLPTTKGSKSPVIIKRFFKNAGLSYLADGDPVTAIASSRQGIPAVTVVQIADQLHISRDKFYQAVRLKRSTIESRITNQAMLAPTESDVIYRIGMLVKRAGQVFEDEATALAWITRDNRALGGVAPLTLMDTSPGYDLVIQTLGRIEQGIVA